MILVALLLTIVVFLYAFSNNKTPIFSSHPGIQNLIRSYGSVPKTINRKVHMVISLRPNINNVITNILQQTERADLMTIIVPEQYETQIKNGRDDLCKLVKDTCVIQISGGYAMLAKERERGVILLYVRGDNAFADPNSLRRMLSDMENDGSKDVYNFNDAICVKNSVKIGVDDAYKIQSTF
jgi:hypothetical protein